MTRNYYQFVAAFLVFLLDLPALKAQTADQSITLSIGWNAVWLEVEPVQANGLPESPDNVFPAQVSTVVTPKPLAGFAEVFAEDPGNAGTFNQDDWEHWNQPATGVNDLVMVHGNRPYLIESTAATTFTVTGKVKFHRHEWQADRYNLLGFGLDGAPTFDDFFAPSNGRHPVARIFRLEAGSGDWVKVNGSSAMTSNEAYWIFSSGPSEYMGPVAVDFDGAAMGKLAFGGAADGVSVDARTLDLEELVFTNLDATAASPALEFTAHTGNAGDLALFAVRPVPGSLSYTTVAQIDSAVGGGSPDLQETVGALSTGILTIGAERNWNSGLVGRSNLYRLKTGGGTVFWLPVSATNSALQAPTDLIPDDPAEAVAGLWVGEVIIDTVTSIVENGAPERPVSSPAPIRIILHSDASGEVKLLSQVTVMQTRSADADVVSTPVLVVDPAKIPFYEGVRERQGKRVGLRVEAVSYAMPRKIDAASQADLLSDSAYPTLTNAAGIPDFLNGRRIRPPSLAEVYHLCWELDGALGAGKTITTGNAPLALDPFHRTNPYRHAFHQQHPRGPAIARDLTIVLASEQREGGRLHGVYKETLKGVVKSDLELSGTVDLRRVSKVDSLEL